MMPQKQQISAGKAEQDGRLAMYGVGAQPCSCGLCRLVPKLASWSADNETSNCRPSAPGR